MTDLRPIAPDEIASVEVRVYHNAELVVVELCESAEEAAAVAYAWEQAEGIECEVHDRSSGCDADDVSEPDLAEPMAEQYPVTDSRRR